MNFEKFLKAAFFTDNLRMTASEESYCTRANLVNGLLSCFGFPIFFNKFGIKIARPVTP